MSDVNRAPKKRMKAILGCLGIAVISAILVPALLLMAGQTLWAYYYQATAQQPHVPHAPTHSIAAFLPVAKSSAGFLSQNGTVTERPCSAKYDQCLESTSVALTQPTYKETCAAFISYAASLGAAEYYSQADTTRKPVSDNQAQQVCETTLASTQSTRGIKNASGAFALEGEWNPKHVSFKAFIWLNTQSSQGGAQSYSYFAGIRTTEYK